MAGNSEREAAGYRLIYKSIYRYAINIDLVPDLTHYLIRDTSLAKADGSVDIYTGETSELGMKKAITQIFERERQTELKRQRGREGEDKDVEKREKKKDIERRPPLMRLDGGKSLLLEVDRVRVIRELMKELERGLEG